MQDYVKDYFDRNAAAWVEGAYAGGSKFPIGPERVRLAIEGVAPAMRDGAVLVDLGCGGGQLCIHAARLGWSATGVDVAPGMIEEATRATSRFGSSRLRTRRAGWRAVGSMRSPRSG